MKKEWVDVTEELKEKQPELFKVLENEINQKHKLYGQEGYFSTPSCRGGIHYYVSSMGLNQPITIKIGF